MNDSIFVGTIITAISIGYMTEAVNGWLVIGCVLIFCGLLDYLNR